MGRSGVDLFKRRVRVGSRPGRGPFIMARTRPVPSVGSTRASLFDVSSRIFFGLGWVFWLWVGVFLGLGQVLGKKSRPVPNPWLIMGQKLWPIPTHCIGHVGSDQVFSARVGRVGWPMIRSSLVLQRVQEGYMIRDFTNGSGPTCM
jgi:hypothetical protein